MSLFAPTDAEKENLSCELSATSGSNCAWPPFLLVIGSVPTAVTLLVVTAIFVLLGAWCPQESAVGQEKIIEQFGVSTATVLISLGVTDLFHTPLFLLDIALLSVSLTVASFRRVFPKLRSHLSPMTPATKTEIGKLPVNQTLELSLSAEEALNRLASRLRRSGYSVRIIADKLVADFGKFGRLAASATHVGLLTLLAGVTITSWTGFSGFQPVKLGQTMSFEGSEHSKLWIGKLPKWRVKVEATRRDDYPTGEAKQWYSTLTVQDPQGKPLKTQEISVNNELTYQGVDIYQSSWGMDQIVVAFNGHERKLDLRPMGQRYAAFLPIDADTVLIFSVKEQDKPLRLFAKKPEWQAPRLLTTIAVGETKDLGKVAVKYIHPIPTTGLQYKSDPGMPLIYIAFGFIIAGACLAAIPHRKVWAQAQARADSTSSILHVGGIANKAKVGFALNLASTLSALSAESGIKPEAEIETECQEVACAASCTAQSEGGYAAKPLTQ